MFAVGLRVQQCQLEADHVREKAHSLQGELAVKRSTLAGLEARGKLSSVRRAVLDAQKEALTETKRRLFAELVGGEGACLHTTLFYQATHTHNCIDIA